MRKIEIIPNGLIPHDSSIKKINISKNKLRYKYGFNKSDRIILNLSRLSYLKGVDLLIEAFGDLAKQNGNYKLVIAGPDEGGQLRKLKFLIEKLKIKNNVFLLGLVEGKKKQELLSLVDVFALFSRYEPFSIATLEALQYNLPVCLSKEVGVAEEVLRYKCGILVENTANSQKSAKQLEWVYYNRKTLAKNCKSALKQFDINNIIDKLIAIYKDLPCATLKDLPCATLKK